MSWQSSTRRNGVSISLTKESATAELKFPALLLLGGTYELTLGITGPTRFNPMTGASGGSGLICINS